uniref:Ig-like domain-containing protein n=1 Tax=Astyanax mexicanus TaxID=7994 RepID=A0A3B1K198_ASTMX
ILYHTGLNCVPSIRVPRNTVWNAPENETLMINCTVFIEPHCWKDVLASWCRSYDKNECRPMTDSTHFSTAWRNISGSQRMFILIFWNLSKQDAGLYRCQTQAPVSTLGHAIRVTVTGKQLVLFNLIVVKKTIETCEKKR